MSGVYSRLRPLACALGVLLSSACSDPVVVAPSQLLVELRSDLVASGQLAYVRIDTLDSTGDNVVQSRWLVLQGPCAQIDGALQSLGSFGVERGNRAVARLRIVGFGPDQGVGIKPLVEQRVDVVFQSGPLSLTVDLTQTCLEKRCSDATQTCQPGSGGCAAIPRVEKAVQDPSGEANCLMAEDAPPAEWRAPEPDGGMTPLKDPCDSTDGMCGVGCTPVADLECGKIPGVMCGDTSECRRGLSCVESFCCESECDDPCDTCSADGSAGSCVKRDFAKSNDVNHCGGCDVPCGSANASAAQCNEGKCGYECHDGWKDCTAGTDGCETHVEDDPTHCGGCGAENVCKYPFCAEKKCANQIGVIDGAQVESLPAHAVLGGMVSLSGGLLIGLGAHLRQTAANGMVRFALYDSNQGVVGHLVAQTDPVDIVDQVGIPSADLPASTVVAVPAKAISEGLYWLFIVADHDVQVMSKMDTGGFRLQQAAFGFGAFEDPIQIDEPAYEFDVNPLDFVAYVVP
jgi:hypothetical protein